MYERFVFLTKYLIVLRFPLQSNRMMLPEYKTWTKPCAGESTLHHQNIFALILRIHEECMYIQFSENINPLVYFELDRLRLVSALEFLAILKAFYVFASALHSEFVRPWNLNMNLRCRKSDVINERTVSFSFR